MKKAAILILAIIMLMPACAKAAGREEFIPFGSMNHWTLRKIKESAVIGGNTKTLYAIGPDRTIEGNTPYVNGGGSPWGTSNVMAKVMGVVKTNNSVYRDKHDGGYCAKMTTHIESVRVLGLMNINVLAAGSIFLGDMKEPITGTKDGPKAMNNGISFNKRPHALRFDYKVYTTGASSRIKMTGFSSKSTVAGKDYAIATLFLQRRSEDKKGNITAQRVGTMVVKWGRSTNGWVENATFEILYGDIRSNPKYDATTMGLHSNSYARNSKGKSVLVRETGWAAADAVPTHLELQFASSHGGAYIGTVGNTLWIDNVRLVY